MWRPCSTMSSPVLTTAVTSAGGTTSIRPRRNRAAPTPPARAVITKRTLVARPIRPLAPREADWGMLSGHAIAGRRRRHAARWQPDRGRRLRRRDAARAGPTLRRRPGGLRPHVAGPGGAA